MKSYIKGQEGENTACRFLESKGYTFITKNFRSKFGEIDLIMKDNTSNTIVFVEVKYYQENAIVPPEYMLTKSKQKKLIKTAQYYIYKHPEPNLMYRFDYLIIKENKQHEHFEHIILT